jgi:DNA-binding CsgD family transcriptional regulator
LPDIAARIFDLVDRIAAAATPADAWGDYLAAGRAAGFDHGLALLAAVDEPLSQRSYADAMPEGWLAAYVTQDCSHMDPIAEQLIISVTPYDFRVAEWFGDRRRKTWHDLNRDAGLEAGMMIPYRADGVLRAAALCGREVRVHPHDRKALEFAGMELLLRLRNLGARPSGANEHELSPRERECLRWIAVGKSDWEIGEILNLSGKTVNVYVERAKQKLQAATRTQAIVFALRRGAILL